MGTQKMKTTTPPSSKSDVSGSLPHQYWFTNEHGNKVTVMASEGEWCMVMEEGKKKPYVLEKEYVLAIRNESSNASTVVAAQELDEELYYIQTGYVGNAILWWGIDSKGYTTDITKAGKYTKERAKKIIQRPQDVAWLCKHVDNNQAAKKLVIDGQYLKWRYRLLGKRK